MKVNGKEVEWVDTPKGYYPPGGEGKMHILWQDEKTGASLLLLKASKGRLVELPHHHPEANQWTIMLSGELERPNGTRTAASGDDIMFSFTPKGKTHGATIKVIRELILIRYYDGPSTRVNE